MAILIAELLYPGVLPVQSPSFAHPCYVDAAEIGINPYAPPANTSNQGTTVHFSTTGDLPGVNQNGFCTTRFNSAWKIVGWESIRFQGTVKLACVAVGRDDNTSPYSPEVTFDITVTGSVADKAMTDSLRMSGAGTYPANAVAHVGDVGFGELLTNANMSGANGSLGPWVFGGLSDTFTDIGAPVYFMDWITYDPSNISVTETTYLSLQFSARIAGNSSVLRYEDGDGNWQYPCVFFLELKARIVYTPTTFAFFEGPDGSRNPDTNPGPPTEDGNCSTDLPTVSADSSATNVGYVTITSTQSLSPDPYVFSDATDALYAVPWLDADHARDDGPYLKSVWTGITVTITEPKYAT